MLHAKKRWPEAYGLIVERVRAIAAEFGVPVKAVVLQMAMARIDNVTLARDHSRRLRLTARQVGPRFGALYQACLQLTLDIEMLDGVTPRWRQWTPVGEE